MNSIEIKNITSLKQLYQNCSLYQELYHDITLQELKQNLSWMFNNKIKFVIAKAKEEPIAICAYWLGIRLNSGKFLQIDSLIVNPKYRGKKIAVDLLNYVENIAREEKVKFYILDSYTDNHKALKLYIKHDFKIKGFHLMKLL
ncbi:MAG: GNAT family N-acetyltransferase [Rickettsiales bacterium]